MKKKILVVFLLLFFIALTIPYLNAEILTNLHGEETKLLYEQTGIILSDNYQKVVKYSDDKAEVLYITNNDVSKCNFVRENGNWVLESWSCISSKSGSASNFIYPFYAYKR